MACRGVVDKTYSFTDTVAANPKPKKKEQEGGPASRSPEEQAVPQPGVPAGAVGLLRALL
jgi:hypothetical protein